MFQINSSGIIQMVNQAAIDHFGWTKGEFVGENLGAYSNAIYLRDYYHLTPNHLLIAYSFHQDEFMGNNIAMICGGHHGKRHNDYLERYIRTGVKHAMGKRRQVMAKRKDGTGE